MKLIRFRVQNFRSVEDSDWIDVGSVSALIGTNESGKTNLLIPLWKLNPAKNGEIKPTADYPRKRYNEIRVMEKKPVFIRACFELNEDDIQHVVSLTGAAREDAREAEVTRDFDGKYTVGFILASHASGPTAASVCQILVKAEEDLRGFNVEGPEAEKRAASVKLIANVRSNLNENRLNEDSLRAVVRDLGAAKGPSPKSTISPLKTAGRLNSPRTLRQNFSDHRTAFCPIHTKQKIGCLYSRR